MNFVKKCALKALNFVLDEAAVSFKRAGRGNKTNDYSQDQKNSGGIV